MPFYSSHLHTFQCTTHRNLFCPRPLQCLLIKTHFTEKPEAEIQGSMMPYQHDQLTCWLPHDIYCGPETSMYFEL